MTEAEIEIFLAENLPLASVDGFDGLKLHLAHAGSGLSRLAESVGFSSGTPYWAFAWGGGLALARHLRAHPQTVTGRRVLDLGAGSGLVGIVAAGCGARAMTTAETDPVGRIAISLNMRANDTAAEIVARDLLDGPPPEAADTILVGDLFYEAALAARTAAFLARCRAAGIEVLVGDPGRASLPHGRLRPIAAYPVQDVGGDRVMAGVYSFIA